ncbi:hypothetical protein CDEF62S_00016 [Castellaniella defragrans]
MLVGRVPKILQRPRDPGGQLADVEPLPSAVRNLGDRLPLQIGEEPDEQILAIVTEEEVMGAV